MKICLISYEFAPFPGGGIATYHNAAAKKLAAAGHEVHVVTNFARHGSRDPAHTHRLWKDGNLTIHRQYYFDERRNPPKNAQFFDVNPDRYGERSKVWAIEPSNQAAHRAAGYVEALHAEVGLDVIESPEFFAEAFYILRRRHCGEAERFPPVCIHGHISSRIAFGTNQHMWEVGWYPHRQLMLREEYCVQHADALLTPSRALMTKYEELFGRNLPELRATIPYFLDLPDTGASPPRALDGTGPYLVAVGRIEPRKGSDLAMRAFARLADDHPDLRLVFLGKEMWHQGESVDDVIAACVPERHRGRIVRLGNVPRERALAAAREAAAFLHPAPWDNYPCATLEAMGVGACCIVSDRGGQSEMVEDGRSGLVFRAGDEDDFAAAIRRVLDDRELAAQLRDGAERRVAEITDPETLLAEKVRLFEAMIERERSNAGADPFATPPRLRVRPELPPLPGRGTVLIDAGSASAESLATTAGSVLDELRTSPDWRIAVLVDPGQDADVPSDWRVVTTIDDPLWFELEDGAQLVYALAGVRFDAGRLGNLVRQVDGSPIPCGSFLWLRPADARVFPYAPDFGYHDALIGGRPLPPVFAVAARHLARCAFLSGLSHPHHRACALLAAAAAHGNLMFQHTGTICGDFYGDLPLVTEDVQQRATGYLDALGLLPRAVTTFGNAQIPMASTADIENRIAAARAEVLEQSRRQGPNGDPRELAHPAGGGIDPEYLAELEKIYREHMALKQMKIVRFLRKLGAFNLARRVFPRSKRGLGPGA